jgi:aryl-alcohol dehydrogenase-like predicted oxidoreductase
MEYTTLGATGLRVSVAGLGCGGNSRIGQGVGLTEEQSVSLVREAMDLGVNFFDTAAAYGTEGIVGRAIASSRREQLVISTKALIARNSELASPAQVIASLNRSLRQLRTDYLDVFMFHAVRPEHYGHVRDQLVPALAGERDKGKFRFLGISETSPNDPDHHMLERALSDGGWDVAMFAFHMMHQGARLNVFPLTRRYDIGSLLMFVVRNIFSRPALLAKTVQRLVAEGKLPAECASSEPLGFLIREGTATSLPDAAYRFARYEPGSDVVLFGTSNVEHLRANVASILKPPLPAADVTKLGELFGALRGVGLDSTDRHHASPPKR